MICVKVVEDQNLDIDAQMIWLGSQKATGFNGEIVMLKG